MLDQISIDSEQKIIGRGLIKVKASIADLQKGKNRLNVFQRLKGNNRAAVYLIGALGFTRYHNLKRTHLKLHLIL